MKNQEPRSPKAINVHDDFVGISDYLPKESLDSIDVIHDLYAQKKLKFVLQLLDVLMKKYPQDPYIMANSGYMVYFCEKRQRGYEILEHNFKLHPGNVYAQCYFARVCILMNRLDSAYDAFEGKLTLEELFPDRTDYSVGELAELLFTFGLFFAKLKLVRSVYFNITQLKQFLPDDHPYIKELNQELNDQLKAKNIDINALEQEIAQQREEFNQKEV